MNAPLTPAWSPLAAGDWDSLFGDVHSLSPWAHGLPAAGHAAFPALNAWNDESSLYVEAEVPGLGLEDLEVAVVGDELTISGERRDVPEDGVAHHRRERGVGTFSRRVRLPFAVDAGAVEAQLQHGVLTVTLPKAPELRPRRIEVKVAAGGARDDGPRSGDRRIPAERNSP
jgi:HSP20 family protein